MYIYMYIYIYIYIMYMYIYAGYEGVSISAPPMSARGFS